MSPARPRSIDPADLATIVSDARLTPEAARVVLHVALLGPGAHQVKGEELGIIVHGGEKPIRAAITRAVHCGYLSWKKAGRGGHELTYTPSEITPPGEGIGIPSPRGGNPNPAEPRITPPGEAFRPPSRARDSSSGVQEEGEEEGAREIERRADRLGPAVDGLRRYLAARVAPAQHAGYVRTVVNWLDDLGFAWRRNDGSSMPMPQRAAALQAALDVLLATDETTLAAPVGDPRNLSTKLTVLIRPFEAPAREPKTPTTAAAAAEATRTTREKGEIAQWATGNPAAAAEIERHVEAMLQANLSVRFASASVQESFREAEFRRAALVRIRGSPAPAGAGK